MSRRKIFTGVVLVIILIFVWYKHALTPVDAKTDARVIAEIPTGSSLSAIASILEEQGAIRSSKAFSLYGRFHRIASSLQAGTYVLKTSMSVPDVVEALRGQSGEEASVTIPEGYTVKDIDAMLTKEGIIKAGDLLACAQTCNFSSFAFLPKAKDLAKRGGQLEGYLYPDTYFVLTTEFDSEAFLSRLLTTFQSKVVDGLKTELTASKRSLHEIITMGSLIEEETRTHAERPIVSGILWKRLDANMGLGVDATVRYILDKPTSDITKDDLDVDSPYNSRKYRGLPPGPIANAGMDSIKAALAPQATEYWYYLHGNDGQAHYAVTNDEHNVNRAKYLQ